MAASSAVCQLQPERVLGLSAPSHDSLAAGPNGLLACASGCFTAVLDAATRQQTHLLRSASSNRRIACVAWAPGGQHLAAGEAGSGACVLVWQLGGSDNNDSSSSSRCVHELKAHKHSITSLRFSPDGRLLLSAGAAPDGLLAVWDWLSGALLWKQQLGADISSVTFTEDGSHVLALGRALFKAWSLSWAPQQQPSRARAGGASAGGSGAAVTLTPRPVKLKEHAASAFVDVLQAPSLPSQPPGSNGVYALTHSGVLVLMRPTGRVVDKAVHLQVRAAFGLAAVPAQVAAACADGVVRLFSSKTLAFRATLPRFVSRAAGSSQFPDACGASFCQAGGKQLAVAYADLSVVLWDVQDAKQISCVSSLLCAHSSCVWGVVPVSSPHLPPEQQQPRCATCATDGTIRFWHLAGAAAQGQSAGRLLEGMIAVGGPAQRAGAASPPLGVQLRCIATSPDGRQLCVGDQHGNLRVYDAASLQLLSVAEAHDGEVLCIDYAAAPAAGGCWAASGGRDGLIHVFDAAAGWQLLDTLDEHDGAVTALRFVGGGDGLVSCGADGSIVFRVLGSADGSGAAAAFRAYRVQTLPRGLLSDVVADPLGSYVLSAGQDGLRQWDVGSGELLRTLQAEPGAGEPVRLCIDPGGVVAVCCHADGCLRLYGLRSGQLLWRAWGHGDIAAAAALTPDLSRLVSVGGDGLVIVWRLPGQLVADMRAAVARVAAAQQHLAAQGHEQQQQRAEQQQQQQQRQPSPESAPAGDAATPAAAAWALGGASTSTPGSDSGSSVLLRIRQGKPLVSIDKLPRWARSPGSPAASSSDGGSSTHASGRAPLLSRFFSGRGAAKGKWQASQLSGGEPDLLGTADSCSSALGSTNDGASPALLGSGAQPLDMTASMTLDDHNRQPQWPSWSLEGDVMVVPADGWEASAGAASTAGTAVPAAAAAALTPPSAPGSAGDVVRDLFREHFSTGVHSSTPAVEQQACGRQSMSALFMHNRASLCGHAAPSSQLAATADGVPAGAAADAGASPAVLQLATAAQQQQQQQQQQRRWRHGQMDDELAGMRERLEGLQALYQQQLAQTKLSPRSRSSKSLPGLDEPPSSSEQLSAARQGRQQSGVTAAAAVAAARTIGGSGTPAAPAAAAGGAAPPPPCVSPARAASSRAGGCGAADASSLVAASTPPSVHSSRSPGPASVHSNHNMLAQLLSCDSPEPPTPAAVPAPAGASPVQRGTSTRSEACDSALRVSIGTCIAAAAADVDAITSDAGTPLSVPAAAVSEAQPSTAKQKHHQLPALAPDNVLASSSTSGAPAVSAAAACAGATVTPHGQHVMWPGWGPTGTWEGSAPSPACSPQPWGAAAGVAAPAGAPAGALPAAVAPPEFTANPCFDMTPLSSTPGSAWQSSKQLGADVATPAAASEDPGAPAVPRVAPSSSHDASRSPAQVQQRPPQQQQAGGPLQSAASSSAGTPQQHGFSSPGSQVQRPGMPATPSSGGSSSSAKKSRAQLKQEKAAAKASALAAASASSSAAGDGGSTPGGMLGLLSRMKRTLPGIRSRGGSQAGAAAEAAASPNSRLTEPAKQQQQQQQQEARTGSLSADEVLLEVPEPHASDAPNQQQKAAAAKRRSAVELAACVDRFRQCTQELQQLWQELQAASMDVDAASQLQQLLTPQRAGGRAATTPCSGVPAAGTAAAPPGAVEIGRTQLQGSSGAEQPTLVVRQQLQQELLNTISNLHAAVAGEAPGGDTAAGAGSPPGTPPWSHHASLLQPRVLHAGTPQQQALHVRGAEGAAAVAQQQQQQQQQRTRQPRTSAGAWR